MGVWLRAKSMLFGMRDGRTHDDPLLAVDVEKPTYFAKRDAAEFAHDKDVEVVSGMKPPVKDYKPVSYEEARARIKDRRGALKEERAKRELAAKKAEEARIAKLREEKLEQKAAEDAAAKKAAVEAQKTNALEA